MKTTLGDILNTFSLAPCQTPYEAICNHSMNINTKFFSMEAIDKYKNAFACRQRLEAALEERLKTHPAYQQLQALAQKITAEKNNPTQWGELVALRDRRRILLGDVEALRRDFYAAQGEKYILRYKNTLTVDTLENIAALNPPLQGIHANANVPFFTRNAEKLAGGEIGVVGGPCLFGADEMDIHITHDDGTRYTYDFVMRKNKTPNAEENCTLSTHFTRYGQHITEIEFENHKTALTLQEYESLAFPLSLAAALQAPFVFPIPDASYKKYLAAVSRGINPGLRDDMLQRFTRALHKITDMYLALAEALIKKYTPPKYIILHERNEEAMDSFNEKRLKYFTKAKTMTAHTDMADAVLDYVSDLAAPFYFWGVSTIIQADSVDEADAMRKCAKIHSGLFTLCAVLYPEMISQNGHDTMYYAKREHKMYV